MFKTKVKIKNKIKLQILKIINPKITENLKYLLAITAFNLWILVIIKNKLITKDKYKYKQE